MCICSSNCLLVLNFFCFPFSFATTKWRGKKEAYYHQAIHCIHVVCTWNSLLETWHTKESRAPTRRARDTTRSENGSAAYVNRCHYVYALALHKADNDSLWLAAQITTGRPANFFFTCIFCCCFFANQIECKIFFHPPLFIINIDSLHPI